MSTRRLIAPAPAERLATAFASIREREGVVEHRGQSIAAELASLQALAAADDGKRRDLGDLPFVTIDPEGSRDLDQAIHLEARADGWRLRYAIADVAAHVPPGGAIDANAWDRAVTVYCPDVRIGLHPPAMSEGFASLLPGQRTKAVVWHIDVESDGTIASARPERAWVRSVAQYSYTGLASSPPPQAAWLVHELAAFGRARADALASNGGVTLAKPSQEVVEVEGGYRLEFRGALPIEQHNAQVSLTTGIAAAAIMLDAGFGVLRTMPKAGEREIARLRHQGLAIGVDWPLGRSYAQMLAAVDGQTAKGAAFLTAATALFRGAQWQGFDAAGGIAVPEQRLHGALGVPYAHVTAPLRRLADRYATECCLAAVGGERPPGWVTEGLGRIGDAMAAGSRKAGRVDRACLNVVESAVLEAQVGAVFEAVGLEDDLVQLSDPAVVAHCEGGVTPGVVQAVRLVSARPDDGPRFAVAT